MIWSRRVNRVLVAAASALALGAAARRATAGEARFEVLGNGLIRTEYSPNGTLGAAL